MLLTVLIGLVMGLFGGFLAGLFGLGGGVVLVPMLAAWLTWQGQSEALIMVTAVATSLASIVFTGSLAVYKHHQRGAVAWRWVYKMAPMIVLGALLGSALATAAPADLLKGLFAGYLLLVGLRMLRPTGAIIASDSPVSGLDRLTALGIGGLSAMLGIGGGTLTVPYLAKRGLVMAHAVATASALGLPIAVFSSAGYLLMGWYYEQAPGYYFAAEILLAIVLGSLIATPVAVALAHRLHASRLRQAFAWVMLLLSAKLLLPALENFYLMVKSAIISS